MATEKVVNMTDEEVIERLFGKRVLRKLKDEVKKSEKDSKADD